MNPVKMFFMRFSSDGDLVCPKMLQKKGEEDVFHDCLLFVVKKIEFLFPIQVRNVSQD